ncbi:TRAP-type mannitol/chloroaromatic compound transport system, substrate-binding protein [Sulfitobacter marinus]|uniref:TRAP-type mannitol/chloroaromatic compound transport system, substrate-binding protein n=1 Tax=Sulfitobacter marinus TaxID=394264 RepID=A0A1I6RUH4_9RHOB|nr:TRAP transporter substrate-binding protein DctP [Sulfitobacter marinus]SFS68351.1 TRAP-type mannitol/chloroaromatic compound transport system, substrate-binding protein [Sulfitobacter marinus]
MTKENMKLNRRSMLRGAAVAAVASPALVGKAIAAGEVTWRVQAHWPKASSSFTASLGVVAAQLEEKTEGAFKLELLGAGEFAKGPDIYNIVRKGVVPMGTISPSYISDQAEAATFAYGIPGTLRQAWEMEHAIKNLGVEALVNEDLNADGVHMMCEKVLPTEMVLSKKIESAADFQGLKIRSSGAMLDYLAAAGAAPQYIPGSELYQSLSSGVVDGAHWGAAIGAQSMSLWEVCKYHYKPVLAQTTDAFILNQDALEGLPDDLRSALVDTITTRFFLRSAEYQHFEAIALTEGVANDGVEVMTLPDDVLEMLATASAQILETEGQKGEKAAKAADIYRTLMKDMGYA